MRASRPSPISDLMTTFPIDLVHRQSCSLWRGKSPGRAIPGTWNCAIHDAGPAVIRVPVDAQGMSKLMCNRLCLRTPWPATHLWIKVDPRYVVIVVVGEIVVSHTDPSAFDRFLSDLDALTTVDAGMDTHVAAGKLIYPVNCVANWPR